MTRNTPLKFLIKKRGVLVRVAGFCVAFVSALFFTQCSKSKPKEVFNPVVAGAFYPAGPAELDEMLNEFMKNVTGVSVEGEVLGVIAPHAGYIYSGQVAAHSFFVLKQTNPLTVIIMAPSHRYPFNGVSVLMKDAYRTPLGEVPIDKKLGRQLLKHLPFMQEIRAFEREHAAEVEIPFVQKFLPEAKVLPLVFGGFRTDVIEGAAEVLAQILKKGNGRYVFVASSDLSHYHPYEVAREMDIALLKALTTEDWRSIYKKVRERTYEMCGVSPVLTALIIASKLDLKPVVLEYKNSGDTAGGMERVVGYGSVAFLKSGRIKLSYDWTRVERKETVTQKEKGEWVKGDDLTREDKKKLLRIARLTLETYVKERRIPEVKPQREILKKKGAVFVTLKKRGILRGCIGGLSAVEPLYLAVQHMTVNSCSKDPRFYPVRVDELEDIEIEISVLSPPVPVKNPLKEIKIGRDGLIIEYGRRRGVLLPQVPVEWGWNLQEYLRQICRKAGLPPDTWKKPGVKLYRFTATVFSEKEFQAKR